MSSKTDMECYGYKVGYIDALCDVLAMLASIPETPEVYKIKETIRKVVEHDDR